MIRIGILTFHGAYNYGAFLQAVSLCLRLNEESDLHAEIIDYTMPVSMESYIADKWRLASKIRHYDKYRFQKRLEKSFERGKEKIRDILSEDSLYSNDIKEFNDFVRGKYDMIIVGSDEVWKLDGSRGFPSPYWLEGDLNCRKVSYAASSRSDWKCFPDNHRIRELLDDFETISVRDSLTYDMVRNNISDQSKLMLNCDPSFLYRYTFDPAYYSPENNEIFNEKTNVIIMCESDPLVSRILDSCDKNKYNMIAVYKSHKGCRSVADLDPFQWMQAMSKADMVIASFYHAVCFSIMLGRPFIAIGTPKKRSKLEDLLIGTSLEDKYIKAEQVGTIDWGDLIDQRDCSPDYSQFIYAQTSGFNDFIERIRQ